MAKFAHFRNYTIAALLFLLPGLIMAQDSLKVSGTIFSVSGEPVSGVMVSIEGVSSVTPQITDSTGTFEMMSPGNDVWVLLTPVGYHKKRIFLDGRSELKIYLQDNDVPSSYQSVSVMNRSEVKRNIVGAFSEFITEDVNTKPYQTIDQNFEGQVAGLRVINHSGMPGDGAFLSLRGISSMNANNAPLYIIDGIPIENPGMFNSQIEGHNYNPITSLVPQDITNITVLKDASAAAIYGSKASNGVILIETLKPTESKTTIDMNIRTGLNISPQKLPVMEAQDFKTYANEVLISSGQYEEEYLEDYPGLFDDRYSDDYYKYNHNTDWQNEVFRNSMITDGYLSVRGGDAIAKYGLSVGFSDHQGILKNSNYSRTNIRFVGTFNIVDWLKMFISTNFNYNTSNLIETGLSNETSALLTSLYKSPAMYPRQFNDIGQELIYLEEVAEFDISNPTAVVTGFEGKNQNYRLQSNVRLEGDLTKRLKWTSVLGISLNRMRESVFQPNQGMTSYMDGEVWNMLKQQSDMISTLFNDNKISFNQKLNEVHAISASAGFRFQTNDFEEDFGIVRNLHPSDQYKNLSSGTTIISEIGGNTGEWNWLSIYADAAYIFKDKYILSANASLDGSSRVGRDADTGMKIGSQPMGVFYSAGAGWRLSEEGFLNDISWLEELKLRASYGITGNDDIGYFNSYSYYMPVLYRSTSGAILGTNPNTTLKYETKTQFNVGVDLALLGERFNLSADYFENNTADMLIFERQPTYFGYQTRPTNGGAMVNKGYEVSANYRILMMKDFKWDIGGNISSYNNEITEIIGGSLITDFEGGQMISQVGDPVNSFYGYIAEGVISSTEEANALNLKNDVGVMYAAGDVKYRDISGADGTPDGVINKYDKTTIGSSNPDFFGGVYTNLKYKRWGLSALFTYSVGNESYNYLRRQTEKMSDMSNQSTAVLNRWQHEGQETTIPRALYDDPIGNTDFSTRWIEDGSYLRFKSLTFSYTIPDKITLFGAEVFRNAKFYVTGNNIFTLTKYLGYDPEFSYSANPMLQGIDYGQVPQASTYMVGIKLGL